MPAGVLDVIVGAAAKPVATETTTPLAVEPVGTAAI
jgi:hypothetical protein